MLSDVTVNQIGNHRFEKLKQRFLVSKPGDLGENESAQFEEAYRLPYNMESYTRNHAQENRMVLDSKQQPEFEFTSDVDWDLIEGLLKTEFVDLNSITKRTFAKSSIPYTARMVLQNKKSHNS